MTKNLLKISFLSVKYGRFEEGTFFSSQIKYSCLFNKQEESPTDKAENLQNCKFELNMQSTYMTLGKNML